jgi:ribosome recycling factor
MEEEIEFIFDGLKEGNDKAIAHLNSELQKIRAGKATPSMLDSVKVEAYGSLTPLSGVANVNTLDARTLSIQPWDKGTLEEISKGVMNANLGLNPQNNGEMIIINVPALTEERRRDLGKKAKADGEHAKISLRNNRKDAIAEIKRLKDEGLSEDRQKDLEAEVQNLTNTYTTQIDQITSKKEVDIMKV